jgi:hypothetical protein
VDTDVMHKPGTDREWNESYYFNFYDREQDICGFMRIGLKPNADERSMFFFLMMPGGGLLGMRASKPLSDGTLSVSGLELVRMEAERRWALRYSGPMSKIGTNDLVKVHMDLTFDCLNSIYDYRDSVSSEGERIARKVVTEHLEQFGLIRGRLEVGDEDFEVEGLGERDHSWGVRDWTAPKMWIWLTAEFDHGTALNVTKLFTEEGEVSAGFVHEGGRNHPLVRADVHTVIDEDGRPIYKFSTDSPLRTTTGNLECLALFAGQIAGAVETIPSAGARVGEIVSAARATLERLQCVGTATV